MEEPTQTQQSIHSSVLDNLPLFLYRVDLDGKITYVNKALQQSLNISIDELLGKTAYDFYPTELADKYRHDDLGVIQNKTLFHDIEENIDPNTNQKNYVEVFKSPIIENDEVIGVQGTFWDVSDNFLTQQQRIKNESLLRTISENSSNFVILLDEDLRILYINRTIEGLQKQDLIGKYLPDLAEKQKPVVEHWLNHTLHTQEMSRYETSFLNKNGETHHFESVVTYIQSSSENASLHVTSTEITEFIHREKQLQEAATVFTHSRDAIAICNDKGDICRANKAFCGLFSKTQDELLGSPLKSCCPKSNKNLSFEEIILTVNNKGYWQGECKIEQKQTYYVLASINAIYRQDDTLQSYVIILSDITEQKLHQQQLEKIAHYDNLTNLPNRYLLDKQLATLMQEASQSENRLAVMYLDLDGFKEVNDQFGHMIGDKVLVTISKKITETLAHGDIVARLGGDEFIIICPAIDQREYAHRYFNEILSKVSHPIEINAIPIQLSASLGITFYPQSTATDSEHLIRQADTAMYEAKLRGKNRFEFFDTEKDQALKSMSRTLSELKVALEENQFELFFQPKVDLSNGGIQGVEALIRWHHPEKGLLLPDQFLPQTQNNDIATDIDEWTASQAIKHYSRWKRNGVDIPISINTSVASLESDNFLVFLKTQIEHNQDFSPEKLTIEILESSAAEDLDQISKSINSCKELGISFSLDDFGTGFSTLGFLKNIPADEVKIDRCFIQSMLKDKKDLSIIRAILGLADAFGKKVVAEGIETEFHGLALIDLGCTYAQGYAIAKPMPEQALFEWIDSWEAFESWASRSRKT